MPNVPPRGLSKCEVLLYYYWNFSISVDHRYGFSKSGGLYIGFLLLVEKGHSLLSHGRMGVHLQSCYGNRTK